MTEIVYHAEPELRRPWRFLGEAVRDLQRSPAIAWQFFVRNLRLQYRRTWLGYLWLLLPTIAMPVVWTYVQSRRIVTLGPTALPYPLHVLSGMVLWQVFVDALNAPLQQLTAGREFLTRTRVPHEALILAGVYDVFFKCAVRLAVLAVALLVFAVPVRATAVLVPLGLVALALLGMAIGLFAAPFGLLYGDVGRTMALATTFWFFLTPVVFAAPRHGLVRWNPVTPLLENTRAWLTSGAVTNGFLLVFAAALLASGMAWCFQRLARHHVVARL